MRVQLGPRVNTSHSCSACGEATRASAMPARPAWPVDMSGVRRAVRARRAAELKFPFHIIRRIPYPISIRLQICWVRREDVQA